MILFKIFGVVGGVSEQNTFIPGWLRTFIITGGNSIGNNAYSKIAPT
jgi:hypothetical protein